MCYVQAVPEHNQHNHTHVQITMYSIYSKMFLKQLVFLFFFIQFENHAYPDIHDHKFVLLSLTSLFPTVSIRPMHITPFGMQWYMVVMYLAAYY